MKILNPRIGMLSNHEVLAHITAMKIRYTELHLRIGGAHAMKAENLETVMKEVREYLLLTPCAHQQPEHITAFMTAIAPFALEKGELLMIVNERPETIAELDCVIEEMDTRFSEERTAEILNVVLTCLPAKPKEKEKEETAATET